MLNFREGTYGVSDISFGNSLGKDLLHLIFLFLLFLFRFGSYFPLFDVLSSTLELQVIDFWTNVSKLEEDWHNDELDESSLTSSNVGGGTVAHHRDVKLLSLLHVTLVEELIKQQVSPLGTDLIWSQRGTDITGMEGDTGYQLLGGLDSFRGSVVNQKLPVLLVLDAKLVQVFLELISQLLHGSHVSKQD